LYFAFIPSWANKRDTVPVPEVGEEGSSNPSGILADSDMGVVLFETILQILLG